MPRRLLPLACLALTSFTPVAPVAAPAVGGSVSAARQDDLDAILDERLAAVAGMPVEAIWKEAQTVAALVGDEFGAPFDVALERALRRTEDGRGVLFLVAARLLGDDPDWEVLSEAIAPVLADEDEGVALGAAQLLTGSDFRSASADVREALADALLAAAEDAERGPELRASATAAAHWIGRGSQIPKARAVLFAFLESADPALRAKGALALGGLGIFEGVPAVESELERLAALPGAEGRLADAYLKQQRIRRQKESELRRARAQARELAQQNGAAGDDLQRVERLIQLIQEVHIEGDKADREDLLAAALDGMLRSLDRHSSYFTPESYKKFEQDLEAEYGGIGAYVGEDPDDRLFTITRPIYSGPAYHAGLMTDDKIVRIEDWPTIGEDVDEIIKRLKGRPGTEVKLYVWREGMDPSLIERPSEDMAVRITRAQITIPPVHHQMLPGGIGLVELTTFSRVASAELESAIRALMAEGMRALILDLRNNTGGLLTEARDVGDLFLPPGKTVVRTKSRVYETKSYDTETPAILPDDMPLVVLVNRFSASASEIVSGALQDHSRATLVGQRTFGKGSVQNLIRMPGEVDDAYADENGNRRFDNWETITRDRDGDGEFDFAPRIKLTIEQYLLPTGRSIHRQLDDEGNIVSEGGIDPDIEVGPTRREQWRLIEMRKLQRTKQLRDWAREAYQEQRELLEELAVDDRDDWSAYPGFDELYRDLDTVLSRDDVRMLLRLEVRRIVQDARGSAFPYGDFEEDVQLQAAIKVLLAKLGESAEDHLAYATTFDQVGEDGIVHGGEAPLGLSSRELDQALALIAEAEEGDEDAPLTRAKLKQLSELIRSMKQN